MEKYLLNTYINKRLKSIKRRLTAYKQNQTPEDLHHIRVDIKKIKALFSFAEDAYKRNYSCKELKSLFRKAGAIREQQINIQLLSVLSPFPKRFVAQLKQEENALQKQFLKYTSHYLKNITHFKNDLSLPERLPNKRTLQSYFRKELKKANKKLHSDNKESTHRYRTKIKNILYVYNILPENLQQSIELDTESITLQQKKVGQWHDLYSAINYLSNQSFAPKITDYISKLKQKESKQFNALFKD